MKRFISLFLVIVMCLSLCACGGSSNKKAFSAAQDAYRNIDDAYEVIEQFGEDIYEAWRMGIYDYDEDDFGLAYLAKKLNLSEDDLRMGIVYLVYRDKWEEMTDEEKQSFIDNAELIFSVAMDSVNSVFSLCVQVVSSSYEANGKTAEVQALLDEAKSQMKEMSEKYSDYEHYPSLKGYYTTSNAFFDFCKNPSGSFEQVKNTINDYRNQARSYISDLNYIFED